MSWAGPRLISAATRLQGIFFWELLIYLIEGLVFLITGLQARTLMSRIGDYQLSELAVSALVVSGVVILARFVWSYPAAYLPSGLNPWIRRKDSAPPWQWVFAVSFTGIRGIVSLAAALALPLAMADGRPFPDRDLILFLTFSVILVTLVGQGLLLPLLIDALGLSNAGRRERDAYRAEEYKARQRAIEAALHKLDGLVRNGRVATELAERIRAGHQDRLRHIRYSRDGDERHKRLTEAHDDIELLMIAAERQELNELFRNGKLSDEERRHIERELDLRETHLLNPHADE
jgi:CPA1 family monovalent cation:H+ antiporter